MRRAWVVAVLVMLASAGCATIDRVSTSTTGTQGDGDASRFVLAVSGTGRYVAFASVAKNLVPGGTDGQVHVYRKDRRTGRTLRVDFAANGASNPAAAYVGAISDDAHLVAFMTDAKLVAADTNFVTDVYVRNITLGTTVLASLMPNGSQIPTGFGAGAGQPKFDRNNRLMFQVGAGTIPPRNRLELRDLAAGTTVSYLKYRDATDRFGVVYLLANTGTNERVTVRVMLNEPDLKHLL